MSRPIANLRLFVAVYPPPALAEAALEAIAALGLPPHRATPAGQVHLTCQFIGDTPAQRRDAVIESVRRSGAGVGAFTLAPLRYITLPRGPRPRLVALETDAPAPLLELQRRLALRLATSARRRPGDRFVPHLTLARFAPGPAAPVDVTARLPPFTVSEALLMRSVLAPDGAAHHEVARIAL